MARFLLRRALASRSLPAAALPAPSFQPSSRAEHMSKLPSLVYKIKGARTLVSYFPPVPGQQGAEQQATPSSAQGQQNAQAPTPQSQGFSFAPPATAGLRSVLTVTGASNTATDPQDQQDSETTPPPASVPTPESGFKVRDTSNLKISPRHDLAMIFTCKVCETRSMKMASKDSYQNGVVVVRCGGCNNLHLIADRLGWFGEPGSIEDFLASQGEEVKKGSTDTLNFTLDDLAGSQISSKGPSEQN